jgi:AraC-like DNA-binding protein
LPKVRAASLINYAEVARFVGLDPFKMLREAGIRLESLMDPDHLIPGLPVVSLFEESARQSGCLGFGVLMAECRRLSNLGAVALLLSYEGTARGVLDTIIRYQSLIGEALAISLDVVGELAIIRTDIAEGLGQRQATEALMGVVCRAISEVVDGRWHPESAHFVDAAPEDLSAHRRVFQCPLDFSSDFNGLACSMASLDATNPGADSIMARHAQRYLDMLSSGRADGSITERTRRSIYLLLPAGRATLEQTSENLGLSPRTLQRLLDKDKHGFTDLLNEVRRELALRYLASSAHNLASIAHMIGYASQSSFTRWFAAEFGVAPAAWRAEERQADGGGPS